MCPESKYEDQGRGGLEGLGLEVSYIVCPS